MTKREIKNDKEDNLFPKWVLWISLVFVVIYGLVNNISLLLPHFNSDPYDFPVGYTPILFFLWLLYIIPIRSVWHRIKHKKQKIGTPVWILFLVLIGYLLFETVITFGAILEFLLDDISAGIFFGVILLIIYFFILIVPAYCIWKEMRYSREIANHKVHILDKIVLSIALLWFLFIFVSNLVIGWDIISAVSFSGTGLWSSFVGYYYTSSTNLLWFFGFIF